MRNAVSPFIDRAGLICLWLMWIAIAALLLSFSSFVASASDGAATGGLSITAETVSVAVSVFAAVRVGRRRPEVIYLAAAVTTWAIGDVFYFAALGQTTEVSIPPLTVITHILFYICGLAALAVSVHRQLRDQEWSVALETLVGGLAGISVLAVLLEPTLSFAKEDEAPYVAILGLLAPLGDLLLVTGATAIAVSHSATVIGRCVFLALGLVIFLATDIGFALSVPGDSFTVTSLLYAGWPVGLACIATWAHVSAKSVTDVRLTTNRWRSLLAPAVATVAGLGVLLFSSQIPETLLPRILAAVTIVLATVPIAYRQQVSRSLARTDDLTGLLNRRAFRTDARARLMPGQRHALLLLDLDRFKEVNDSLGHEAGDQLLIQIGLRLGEQMQDGYLLGRLGGDEFAVLIPSADRQTALEVANSLRLAVSDELTLRGITIATDVSIGIALFPDQADGLSALLRKADMAMYKSKADSRGPRLYSGDDDSNGAARLRTLHDLRLAICADEFVLHYQPKVNLASGDVVGVEALVRWNHPTLGLVPPGDFLSIVEESGLMPDVTRLVLNMALDQAALWRTQGHTLTVAVNLSPSSLADDDLTAGLLTMLARRGLPTSALTLEITEDGVMADRQRAHRVLADLRHSGIRISVDDFGTGYSSLAYLRDLPVDEIKLDQSFVKPMSDDARAVALVAGAVGLVHGLDLRLVAEGVETSEVLEQLTQLGCDEAQGYFISRPISAAAFDHWLAARLLESARA